MALSLVPACACSKVRFYSRFLPRRVGNGAYRGGTEELDDVCGALVSALTLRQSLRKSKTVPLGSAGLLLARPASSSPHPSALQRLSALCVRSQNSLPSNQDGIFQRPRSYWDQSSHTSFCWPDWCSSPVVRVVNTWANSRHVVFVAPSTGGLLTVPPPPRLVAAL